MILECPLCHSRYMVPISAFASGGRQVRCARCKNQWHATLPTTVDVFVPMPPAAREEDKGSPNIIEPTPNLPAVTNHMKWPLWFKRTLWAAVSVSLMLVWPIMDRQPIVKALPSLRFLYEAVGLPIPHYQSGLVFDQVKSELRYDGGTMHLFVDGVIHNATGETQFIPDIKARALGPDKHIIQSWWVEPPAATIDAGSDVPFHTDIISPMEHTIEDVYLEFYARDEKSDVSK